MIPHHSKYSQTCEPQVEKKEKKDERQKETRKGLDKKEKEMGWEARIEPSIFSLETLHLNHSTSTIPPQPSHLNHPTSTIPPQPSHLNHPTSTIPPQPSHLNHPTSTIPPQPSHLNHSTTFFGLFLYGNIFCLFEGKRSMLWKKTWRPHSRSQKGDLYQFLDP